MEKVIKPAFFFDRPLTQLLAIIYSILTKQPYKVIEIVQKGRINHRIVPNYQVTRKSA